MEKKCFSVMTDKFEKSIQDLSKDHRKKLFEQIEKLEEMENNPDAITKFPGTHFGKTLTSVNRNIYVMEIGTDRALAVIVKKDDKKVYTWFWGGSHESYNKTFTHQSELKKKEHSVREHTEVIIDERIAEIKKESQSSKSNVLGNMHNIRDKHNNHGSKNSHHKKSYK
jgi:mRNA-degrading endonuclease RelE of RelBE toxin-antitoxin system